MGKFFGAVLRHFAGRNPRRARGRQSASGHGVIRSVQFRRSVVQADRRPLFLVIIATAAVGVLAGGTATWLGQRRWRRAARRHQADARQARAQLADLRASGPARQSSPSVRALPSPNAYGSSARDKQIARWYERGRRPSRVPGAAGQPEPAHRTCR